MKIKSLISMLLGAISIASATDSTRVLFIGNSFTGNNDMPGIFQKICKSKNKIVHVEKSWKGGASIKDQTLRPEMFSAIKKGNWDFVILQGWSKEFIQEQEYIDSVTIPYASIIIDSIKINNPCAKILFYETWGYHENKLRSDSTCCMLNNIQLSYEQMSDTISKGYAYLNKVFSYPVVPVGSIWKVFRTKYPNINLYDTADYYHPNKIGSYLSASTFYTCIFHESPEGAMTKSIDYESALKIQKLCAQSLVPNLDNLGFNSNYVKLNSRTTNDGKFELKAKAFEQENAIITWNLGNGKSLKGTSIEYTYPKPGQYKVIVTVKSACGTRTYSQWVHFKEKNN